MNSLKVKNLFSITVFYYFHDDKYKKRKSKGYKSASHKRVYTFSLRKGGSDWRIAHETGFVQMLICYENFLFT
ncbi:MAG: hypothetical protein DWB56_03875 [Candidatus Jettenia sp.]|nr:MAG: hypothetical protein EDM77_02550 [Candidatus Jettenia sp. AMX1]MBC6928100.1 hypothetical protein [Candidatus Jettenia sp.]MCE7879260.1 hypothetical protein [Candidatus Jettenia sp. AMX1]MCQ3927515.1 hypothetical protein [Candidatus Jettenia sp.]